MKRNCILEKTQIKEERRDKSEGVLRNVFTLENVQKIPIFKNVARKLNKEN